MTRDCAPRQQARDFSRARSDGRASAHRQLFPQLRKPVRGQARNLRSRVRATRFARISDLVDHGHDKIDDKEGSDKEEYDEVGDDRWSDSVHERIHDRRPSLERN